ncbi:MAG TPA: hypothetical protein VH143_25805 [Kofleriaceae bacterium]|jgi:hypothetical protein|nr:hypothetical protein [Kofleriaceae bacterium]
MHVVAITRLATTPDAEAVALAGDLATLVYEQKLKLSAALPVVVLKTRDEARAGSLLAAIRARGHAGVRCNADDVVASEDMILVRQPRLDPGALVSGRNRLRWEDIALLVRASVEGEGLLYAFTRSGGTPWLVREQRVRFDALGDAIVATSLHNFAMLVDALRTRARSAAFDERLVARRTVADEIDLLAHVIALSAEHAGASPFR